MARFDKGDLAKSDTKKFSPCARIPVGAVIVRTAPVAHATVSAMRQEVITTLRVHALKTSRCA
jgi:hypothetical protein